MRNNPTQASRPIAITTPLGADVLLLHRFSFREELGRPFELVAELQSVDAAVDVSKILGQAVTVSVKLGGGGERHFNGCVSAFTQSGAEGDLYRYRATVVPWLWLLTRGADCRIFQKMAVPEILKQVFHGLGFSDYREALTRSYPQRGVCVQYRETHFQFVSRLMEHEGISYFFEHTAEKHTLVLCDSPASHATYPGYETVRFNPIKDDIVLGEHVWEWIQEHEVQPGIATVNDYDYVVPRMNLIVSAQTPPAYAHGGHEAYDAPGGYETPDDGQYYASVRLQERQGRLERQRGRGFVLGLAAGAKFALSGHPAHGVDQNYLATAVQLTVISADFSTGQTGSEELTHQCDFSAVKALVPFRPARTTPRPLISGVQNAVVTGPAGHPPNQPFTTAYGSVKVQFRWDRHGQSDENSSGWIRVSQISAGPGWGSMFIPRIGNEVVVAFEEGDPDRPVVIGRLYNAGQMPPLPLPANSIVSYVIDDGGNAISLYPKSGSECVLLYCPHNDSLETIGARPN